MNKAKIVHLIIIISGIIFIFIPAFHTNIWFDESYTVGLANKGFFEIWKITGNDVHPALYYWLLHIVYLIFGENILIYRLFSVLAIAILGIIGYTHIRKDFGEKVGIIFSYLTYFLPIMNTYAQEIRMYSWSCLIVTLMAIYAYRFYKSIIEKKQARKNLCIFGVFSICCCYIHYYALVTTGLVNLVLLIYLIRNRKNNKTELRDFLILAVIQICLYIPWLIYLIAQLKHVGGGFWITLDPIRTTTEVLCFQFIRQVSKNFSFDINTIISITVTTLVYIYMGIKIYKLKKQKEEIKPAILSGAIYLGVIIIMLVISIVSPILYPRYLLVMTGLYIFAISFIMSKEKNKIITIGICSVILIIGISSNIQNVQNNYDKSNNELCEYINKEVEQKDKIIYNDIERGGVVAAYFPNNKQYFFNSQKWDVEEAYKAFGPGMETVNDLNFLEEYHGKIWLIDTDNAELLNNYFQEDNVLKKEKINTRYRNYVYNIILIERN